MTQKELKYFEDFTMYGKCSYKTYLVKMSIVYGYSYFNYNKI